MLKAREIVIVFIIIKWLFHFIVTILRELRLQLIKNVLVRNGLGKTKKA